MKRALWVGAALLFGCGDTNTTFVYETAASTAVNASSSGGGEGGSGGATSSSTAGGGEGGATATSSSGNGGAAGGFGGQGGDGGSACLGACASDSCGEVDGCNGPLSCGGCNADPNAPPYMNCGAEYVCQCAEIPLPEAQAACDAHPACDGVACVPSHCGTAPQPKAPTDCTDTGVVLLGDDTTLWCCATRG